LSACATFVYRFRRTGVNPAIDFPRHLDAALLRRYCGSV